MKDNKKNEMKVLEMETMCPMENTFMELRAD
jgi:hypothetical protein